MVVIDSVVWAPSWFGAIANAVTWRRTGVYSQPGLSCLDVIRRARQFLGLWLTAATDADVQAVDGIAECMGQEALVSHVSLLAEHAGTPLLMG